MWREKRRASRAYWREKTGSSDARPPGPKRPFGGVRYLPGKTGGLRRDRPFHPECAPGPSSPIAIMRGVTGSEEKKAWKGLAHYDPEWARAHIAADAELSSSALAGLKTAVRGDPPFSYPQKWAIKLYYEICKLVGSAANVTVNLWTQVGVKDESEARRLIAQMQQVERMDELERIDLCERYLLDAYARHPERARASRLLQPPSLESFQDAEPAS